MTNIEQKSSTPSPAAVSRHEPDFDLTMNAVPDQVARPTRSDRSSSAASNRKLKRRKGSKAGVVLGFLSLMTAVGVGAAAYLEITSLRAELGSAQRSLDSMSLLTEGQYEDLRVALDSAADQRGKWGAKVDSRLSFLDSEIRKLWVVAHQTNQPRIAKLEEELKGISTERKKNSASLAELQKSVAALNKDDAILKKQAKTLEQLSATVSEQEIRLNDVPVALDALRLKVDGLSADSKDISVLIEQLNQSRAQINRSIDQLTQELRVLKGDGSSPGL